MVMQLQFENMTILKSMQNIQQHEAMGLVIRCFQMEQEDYENIIKELPYSPEIAAEAELVADTPRVSLPTFMGHKVVVAECPVVPFVDVGEDIYNNIKKVIADGSCSNEGCQTCVEGEE